MKKIIPLFLFTLIVSCSNEDSTSTTQDEAMYFPPIGSSAWETKTVASLGWNESQVQPLLDYLELKHTKSFIILHNGKIVRDTDKNSVLDIIDSHNK